MCRPHLTSRSGRHQYHLIGDRPAIVSTIMQYPITGAIIADGCSRRFRRHKGADLQTADRPIIQRLIGIFKDLFAETLIVTDRPRVYFDKDVYMASGLYASKGPLVGIHAALFMPATPRWRPLHNPSFCPISASGSETFEKLHPPLIL